MAAGKLKQFAIIFSWNPLVFDNKITNRYISPMLEITYKASPLRILRRMQPKTARQIQARINAIAADLSNPDLGVKPLAGRPGFRLRVGTWRIIFVIEADRLEVLAIEPRGQAYKPRRRR